MQESFHPHDVQLRPWQAHALVLLGGQTEREVLFVVDPRGNKEKTYLAKYIRANQDAIYMTTTGMGDVVRIPYARVFDLARLEVIKYGTIE